MNSTDWKDAGRYFRYREHDIFYRDEGRGDVLLCIHGYPTASWDWNRVWVDLTDRYRVIVFDMIGFGFSDKPYDYPYSTFDQADLVGRLLEYLDVNSIDILAHDYGDTVAQELLARFEERHKAHTSSLALRSVCFLNGGLFPESYRPLFIQKVVMSPIGPLTSWLLSEKTVKKNFASVFGAQTKPSEEDWKEFWNLINFNSGLRITHKLMRYMVEREKNRERWVGVLQRTEVPMRLICGASDPISGSHVADRFRQLVPDHDVVLLEDIGHYPQVEDPTRVVRGFLEFRSLR